MEKLKEEQITPYYPYKLKLKYKDGTATEIFNASHLVNFDYNFSYMLLLLHPLSDLTKEIEVDGFGIIPLISLLKIHTGSNWGIKYFEIYKGDEEWAITNVQGGWSFGYNSINQGFYLVYKSKRFDNIKHQLILFQQLFEWHFDIFGLIEKGLAIDINTLSQ